MIFNFLYYFKFIIFIFFKSFIMDIDTYFLNYYNHIMLNLENTKLIKKRIKIYFNHIIDDQAQYILVDNNNNINPFNPKFTIKRNILYIQLNNDAIDSWKDLKLITNNIYVDIYSKMCFLRKTYFNFYLLYWKQDISIFNIHIFKYINYEYIDDTILKVNLCRDLRLKFIYKNKSLVNRSLVNRTIPKKIFQTWKDINIINHRYVQNIIKMNKDFNYKLYDDVMCLEYIKNNYDGKILNCYLRLNNPVARADFWRYCILYNEGGIYVDIDSNCLVPFNEYINFNQVMAIPFINYNTIQNNFNCFIQKESENKIFQGFIATIPKNPVLLKCINMICNNIDLYLHRYDVLNLTGINIFYKAFNSYLGTLSTKYYQSDIIHDFGVIRYGLYNNNSIYFQNKLVLKCQEKIPNKINGVTDSYKDDKNIYQDIIYYDESYSFDIDITFSTTNLLLITKYDRTYSNEELIYNRDMYEITILNQHSNELLVFIRNKHDLNINLYLKINYKSIEIMKFPEPEKSEILEPEPEKPELFRQSNEQSNDVDVYFHIYEENIPKVNFTISNIDNCFDWRYYLNRYIDLRRAGILNEWSAKNHWNRFGKKEMRVCSKIHELTIL